MILIVMTSPQSDTIPAAGLSSLAHWIFLFWLCVTSTIITGPALYTTCLFSAFNGRTTLGPAAAAPPLADCDMKRTACFVPRGSVSKPVKKRLLSDHVRFHNCVSM